METSCLSGEGEELRGEVSGFACKGLLGLLLYVPVWGGVSRQREREREKGAGRLGGGCALGTLDRRELISPSGLTPPPPPAFILNWS